MSCPSPDSATIQIQAPLISVSANTTTSLDQALTRLDLFLRLLGFHQDSLLSFGLSWLGFLAIGVTCPFLIIEYFSYCSDCEKYQIKVFEPESLVPLVILSGISLLCVSRNLRKYGIRKLLFRDTYRDDDVRFYDMYVHKIKEFFRTVFLWTLLCSALKLACEVVRATYVHHNQRWQSVLIIVALFILWMYLTAVFLSGAAVFNLVCSVQVIHFESYGKLLERDLDVLIFVEEHTRLTYYLSKISHRFRLFLLLEFLVVNASLFIALLQTTGNHGILNLINGGDFGVSSIIEIVGIILCLQAAAKITHRAQGIVSVASRWHAYFTCNNNPVSQEGYAVNGVSNLTSALPISFSFRNRLIL